MPSTYSSLLRLELMATGEKSATWGDITNTNLGTLLEKSIAGLASVNVTAGNVTLTALNGTDDESRCAIISVTGTPGVSRNVVAPSSAKLYAVINGSNAAIVFKGAATTGVTLSAGEKAWLAWNGSDFVQIGVPQTSPTFFGQVIGPSGAVGTPSFSFTGDTDNGWWAPAADTQAWSLAGAEVMRLNSTGLGVGMAANAVMAVRKNSTSSSESSAGLYITSGTGAGTAGIQFGADQTAGYGYIQTLEPTVSFSTKPLVLMPNGGSVGVGTVPAKLLHVSGNGVGVIRIQNTGASGRSWDFNSFISGVGNAGFELYDATAAAARIAVDSSGRVLIGATTATASAKLEVRSDTGIRVGNATISRYRSDYYSDSSGTTFNSYDDTGATYRPFRFDGLQYQFQVGSGAGTTALAIDSGGQVGIGVSPAKPLHVKSATAEIARLETTTARGSGGVYLNFQDPTGAKGYIGYGSANDKFELVNQLNADMNFYTNGTLRFTIAADGRIGGSGLHNNANSPTGTSPQYIASGTYTPTITNGTNVSASTARKSQWIRVGNVVTASITVTTTQTNVSAVTDIGVSLPIASNLAVTYDLAGTGFRYDAAGGGGSTIRVIGDATNDRASLTWISNTAANTSDLTATFTYEVL